MHFASPKLDRNILKGDSSAVGFRYGTHIERADRSWHVSLQIRPSSGRWERLQGTIASRSFSVNRQFQESSYPLSWRPAWLLRWRELGEPQLIIFQLPSACLQPTPLPWFGRPATLRVCEYARQPSPVAAPGSTKPKTPLAPRQERFCPESSAPTCACHAARRPASVNDTPSGPPRATPSAEPVGIEGVGIPTGAGAPVAAAAPAGVGEPVIGGASLDPML